MNKLQAGSKGLRKYTLYWPLFFLGPFIICFLAFNLFPILFTLRTSFFEWDGMADKVFVGLANYKRVLLEDANFRKSIVYTLRIMLLSYPISIFLGLSMAACLSNLKRGRHVAQTVNFLPYITTPVAIGLIFSFLFDWSTGIVNKILMGLGLIDKGMNWLGDPKLAYFVVAFMIIWKSTGYYMAIYLAGITSISEDVFEAARADGASAWKIFWRITIPMLKPITVFVVVTSIISGLQMFDEPNLLFNGSGMGSASVGGPNRSCLTIVWNFYDVSFKTTSRLGYGSAVAIVLFALIVLCAVIGMKLMNRKEEG